MLLTTPEGLRDGYVGAGIFIFHMRKVRWNSLRELMKLIVTLLRPYYTVTGQMLNTHWRLIFMTVLWCADTIIQPSFMNKVTEKQRDTVTVNLPKAPRVEHRQCDWSLIFDHDFVY